MGKSAEDYFKSGNNKLDQGDLDGAIADYNAAIRLKHDFTEAYYNRGNAKSDKEDLDGAIADYDAAIRLKHDFTEAYYNRGNAKSDKEDLDGAIADYDAAIRLKHDFTEAYNNRGKAKRHKRDLDGSIADYNAAIRLKPDFAEAYYNRGITKDRKGDLDGAITDFTKAIHFKTDFAEAYNYSGIVKEKKGDFESAIVDYNEVIRINRYDATAYNNRGNAKKGKGDFKDAIADYNEAIRIDNNYAEPYYNLGNIKLLKGDLDGAIADYNKTIRINLNFAEAFYNLGNTKLLKGDLDGAISDFNETIQLNSNFAEAYNSRGIAKGKKKFLDDAIIDFNKAVRIKPDFAEAFYNRGNTKFKVNLDDAIYDYTEAIRINPNYAEAYSNRGNAKKHKGDLNGALNDFNTAIEINDNFALTYYNRGIVKKRMGYLDEAIDDFDQANVKDSSITKSLPLLCLSQVINGIFKGKDKEQYKKIHNFIHVLFQNITNLQEEFATPQTDKEKPPDKGKQPMHFTDLNTLRNLAQGKHFRLYHSSLMSDKNEGKIFFEMLFKENQEINTAKMNDIQEAFSDKHDKHDNHDNHTFIDTFIGSFVMDSDVDDGDNLMWCVYGRHKGKESSGCAFVFKNDTFSPEISSEGFMQALIDYAQPHFENERFISAEFIKKLTKKKDIKVQNDVEYEECFLYPVVYSNDSKIYEKIKEELEQIVINLNKILDEMDKHPNERQEIRYLVGGMLDLVRFLFKHKLYARENEARLVVWRIKGSKAAKKDPDPYVECPKLDFERIILGPDVKNVKAWKDWLKKKKISEDKVRKSMDPISPKPK